MTRPLSSKMTFYYKRVSPILFFGVVLLMFGFGLLPVLRDRQVSNVTFQVVLLLLAVFANRFMKKSVFNLADEVLDAGNALVVEVARCFAGSLDGNDPRGLCCTGCFAGGCHRIEFWLQLSFRRA